MKKKKSFILGIDIGGTKIAACVISEGKIISPIYTTRTPDGKKILSVVEKYFKKLSKKYEIKAVGVSTAGMVNNSGQIVGSCGNINNWEGTKVKSILEKKFKVPVVVENDANSAAYGEYKIGKAKEADPLLMITLGTGVGGGLIANGKLVRGSHFAGGEIGHIKLSYTKQRLCTCGKYDCLEAYASGNGLIALIKHYLPTFKKPFSTKKLFELAKKKNKNQILAIRAIEDWHFFIACGICSLIQQTDPKKVVLSGGLREQIDLKYLTNETIKLALPAMKNPLKNGLIVKSNLKNNAGLLGASLLAYELL